MVFARFERMFSKVRHFEGVVKRGSLLESKVELTGMHKIDRMKKIQDRNDENDEYDKTVRE